MTDMKKSRFTEEQIISFIRQAAAGMPIKKLCRKGGFSDATFYKWRAKYGGMDVPDAKRLRELEGENAKLKKLLAEAHLDIHVASDNYLERPCCLTMKCYPSEVVVSSGIRYRQ
jgi:putative transposase